MQNGHQSLSGSSQIGTQTEGAIFWGWLPEPIPTSEDGPSEFIVRDELLSCALLVLLEKLSPAERAVFVLREALGFDYAGIADIICRSEANCRKLFSRAIRVLLVRLPRQPALDWQAIRSESFAHFPAK